MHEYIYVQSESIEWNGKKKEQNERKWKKNCDHIQEMKEYLSSTYVRKGHILSQAGVYMLCMYALYVYMHNFLFIQFLFLFIYNFFFRSFSLTFFAIFFSFLLFYFQRTTKKFSRCFLCKWITPGRGQWNGRVFVHIEWRRNIIRNTYFSNIITHTHIYKYTYRIYFGYLFE